MNNARWIWITTVGMLAFTQWALWSDAPRELERVLQPEVWGPAEEARGDAVREARVTAEAIQRLRQVDHFSAIAVSATRMGAAISLDPAADPDAEAHARVTLDHWGLDAPRVAVGLHDDPDFGWPAEVARPPMLRIRHLATGTDADGQGWCIRLGGERTSSDPDWALLDPAETGPTSYGACWLWARYGMPGPAIAEWMAETGLSAATTARATPDDFYDETAPFLAVGGRLTANLPTHQQYLADACIGGGLSHCRSLFLTSPVPSGMGSLIGTSRWSGFLPRHWLHSLEAEHGPEKMADFWTSDADVATAFETAFGADLETTMMELGRARFGNRRTGPRLAGAGWLGLLGALVIGVGSAVSVTRRRSVA